MERSNTEHRDIIWDENLDAELTQQDRVLAKILYYFIIFFASEHLETGAILLSTLAGI
jgi:hypothetical protein